jgi:hypothetical protein
MSVFVAKNTLSGHSKALYINHEESRAARSPAVRSQEAKPQQTNQPIKTSPSLHLSPQPGCRPCKQFLTRSTSLCFTFAAIALRLRHLHLHMCPTTSRAVYTFQQLHCNLQPPIHISNKHNMTICTRSSSEVVASTDEAMDWAKVASLDDVTLWRCKLAVSSLRAATC